MASDKLPYLEDLLLQTKLLSNRVISDASKGVRFMSIDLKDYSLASPIEKTEYMQVHCKYFPPNIMHHYDLNTKLHHDHVYCKKIKDIHGLKQAALLAYNYLQKKLEPHDYYPIPHAVKLCKHTLQTMTFCLCTDDFVLKLYNYDDIDHLIATLKKIYKISLDWTRKNIVVLLSIGITSKIILTLAYNHTSHQY